MSDDYQEFTAPTRDPKTGKPLSLPQRRAYKKAIEERENFAARAKRDLPRVSEFLRETVGGVKKSAKEMGKEAFKEVEGLRELGTTVGPVVKEVAEDVVLAGPRAKAAAYSDPEGAKEFGRAVVSGDRPAIRTLSEEVSKSAVEPFATGAEAVLGGLAAEEGKYGEAAMYGGMLLLPGVLSKLGPKMSRGWLKSAAEAGEEIPDEAAKKMNDLAKRVDEGKVTDDMQIRREIAMIEDAHASDYQASLADVESDFDFESFRGKPPGGVGRDVSPSIRALDTKGQADEMQRELDSLSYAGQMESEGRVYMDEDLGEHFANRYSDEVHAEVARRIKAGDKYGSETFYEIADPEDYLPSGGGKPPGGGARKRAALRSAKLSKYSEDEIDNAVDRLRSGDIEADISNHKFFAEAEGRSVDQEFIDMKQRDLARLRSRDLSDDEIAEHIEGRRAANRRYAEAEGGGTPSPRDPDFEMRREISTRDAFYDDRESGGKLFRIGDRYIEAADVDDALRLATNDDGLEHYVRVPRLDAYDDDDLRRLITEASPEESAKYFEMKRVNPRGDESGFSQPRSGGGSEGPSEAEIQAMVNQRFGDPNELEMMKEDMRRMAELTQDEQIAQAKKNRTRRSRTPGAPGATEGSVKRERPIPKKN